MDRLVEGLMSTYEQRDEMTRLERAERAAWLARFGWPESGWLLAGDGVAPSWDDLRQSFIDGSYLAVILVGQAFLENLVAGHAFFAHDPEARGRPRLLDALRRAHDEGWLTRDEFVVLDGIRRMRNPYAHYRSIQDGDSLFRRAIAAEESPYDLLERDAYGVMKALYHLVNRPPFAMGPIIYPYDEEPIVHPDQMHLPV